MPRRHRSGRGRDEPAPVRALGPVAPGWAQVEGYRVHRASGTKAYRCPGCQQEIHPRTDHLVVVPDGDVESRRHWHTPCWSREIRARGPAR